MCVIILAAGIGKRMKAYGPKCTIELNSNETVIGRQIRLMKKALPNYNIIVVVGFQKAKVLKIIDVEFIENKKYIKIKDDTPLDIESENDHKGFKPAYIPKSKRKCSL